MQVTEVAMKDRDAIIKKIDSLEGKEQRNIPWLLSLLDHSDNIVRFAAIRPLIYRCCVPNFKDKLWLILDTEPDDDIILLVIGALADHYKGSKDVSVIRRFQKAIERVAADSDVMQDVLDDAKLRIMLGLDTKQIVKTSPAERRKQLAELNVQLGIA